MRDTNRLYSEIGTLVDMLDRHAEEGSHGSAAARQTTLALCQAWRSLEQSMCRQEKAPRPWLKRGTGPGVATVIRAYAEAVAHLLRALVAFEAAGGASRGMTWAQLCAEVQARFDRVFVEDEDEPHMEVL